ncbi:DUF4830 domain-containing protein [Fusibacter bizertensis]|uniref:DUF4830 domain-containing protein n=1 Tax=Fusibacter bizertensis TaxID=1488331 RepID=A0ABT6N8N7_9FIRM|nr:DUF4830 domain-containing protein [Fusibacter bizertensis]MDH8676792.1 DUF4830 domain-containing protein [Fusibacter bizertensis]
MKQNRFKQLLNTQYRPWHYIGLAIALVILVFVIKHSLDQAALDHGSPDEIASSSEGVNTSLETSDTSDTAQTTEPSDITPESFTKTTVNGIDYYYIRPKLQRRVIALRELEPSEYPAPYDFSDWGIEDYEGRIFYAVVMLDIDTDVRLKTETITVADELQFLGHYKASSIEQVYRQLSIRYEDNYATYHYERTYYVTSLKEPTLYKRYEAYENQIPSKNTDSNSTILVLETISRIVEFDINSKKFNHMSKLSESDAKPNYDLSEYTIKHMPLEEATLGPAFSKITDEPRLRQLSIGSGSDVVFDKLGLPKDVKWLEGYYLLYDDLMLYLNMVEEKDTLTFYPILAADYYGPYPVAGIKVGMSLDEVLKIVKPSLVPYTQGSELVYPISIANDQEDLRISIDFNTDFKVCAIRFNYYPDSSADSSEKYEIKEQITTAAEKFFDEEKFAFKELHHITDFKIPSDNCYFNASTATSKNGDPVDEDFYTYNLTLDKPQKISDQPMRLFFEMLDVPNPCLITIGKDDGIMYQIDLNSFTASPLTSYDFSDYAVVDWRLIKASLLSDTLFMKNYGYTVSETFEPFEVKIPKDWTVKLGTYPVGQYWQLVNVFSKANGLDLSEQKGKTVTAHVYRINEQIATDHEGIKHSWPTDLVILRDDSKIVGAWLKYNISSIGPSFSGKALKTLTGLELGDWLVDESAYTLSSTYKSLEKLSPDEVIKGFFNAVDVDNKEKANMYLTPRSLFDALSSNIYPVEGRLYHTGFNENNSITENIVSATDVEVVSYFEPMTFKPITEEMIKVALQVGDRIEVEVLLNLKWKMAGFNTEGEKSTQFITLTKYPFGWKIEGLATGR